MIKKLKVKGSINGGAIAFFGDGTIIVSSHPSKETFQIQLTQCLPSEIGQPVSESVIVPNTPRIVLDFISTKSIDVLIQKLEELKKDINSNES